MFNLFKRKEQKVNLTNIQKEEFESLLTAIGKSLHEQQCYGQKQFLDYLLRLLSNGTIAEFIPALNGKDMWGGAGAVWEIYIEDKNKKTVFEDNIVRLITLMDEAGIMGKGAKSIRRIFENNNGEHA